MQKIVPHLWFDKEARQAAEFYISLFPDSRIVSATTLKDTPSGDAETVSFEIAGQSFMAISAGPYFKPGPAISFMLNFDPSRDEKAAESLDRTWAALSEGGNVMMPLQEYPFSKRYGWVEDRFGVSWQLILSDPDGEERPFVTPSLMFVGDVAGKAEEATDFYLSVFEGGKRGTLARYPAGSEPDREGTVMYTDFQLAGQWLAAMDSAHEHAFSFTEGVSLMIRCETQEEIDRYWEKLSAVPEAEQCGWLKDRYGVSWQVVPTAMDAMMASGDPEKVARVTQAFLKMKKFDIATLQAAADGK